jgi:hypothetical protein
MSDENFPKQLRAINQVTISTAGTSVKVGDSVDRLIDWICQLADLTEDENGQFQVEMKHLGIDKPEFELCITPQGLAIFEPKANVAFTFAKREEDDFARLVNLICPEWALKKLMFSSPSQSCN